MAVVGDLVTLKEFYSTKDDANVGFNPLDPRTEFVGHTWRNNDNGIELSDHDPWFADEHLEGFHFRVREGYRVTISMRIHLGFYIGKDIIHSQAFNSGIMKEGGTITSYYPLVNDSRFRAVDQIPHTDTGASVDYNPKFELTMSGGDYFSLDLSGGVDGIGSFTLKLGNDTYRYKEGINNWLENDEGFETGKIYLNLVNAYEEQDNSQIPWYAYMLFQTNDDGSQLVMWGRPVWGYTWNNDTDLISQSLIRVESKGGGDMYARVIMKRTIDGVSYLFLSDDMSYWAPEGFTRTQPPPAGLTVGDGSTLWFDSSFVPDDELNTWNQFVMWAQEDFNSAMYTYGTDIREKYNALLASPNNLIRESDLEPWYDRDQDTWDDPPEPDPEDPDPPVIIDPDPPEPPTPPEPTNLDPESLQYIYAEYHAGRSGGFSDNELSPFSQFLLYTGQNRSGYSWLDQNTIRIREYSETDAGWYDWINNEENLDTTGAIRLVPSEGSEVKLELYSSTLGTFELTLYGDTDENVWNDRVEIDVDGNSREIAHLKIVAGGVSLIDESSGFNENFEITLLSYKLPSGKVVIPPTPDPDPEDDVIIPPFNWGDLILVAMFTVMALYATAWILKRAGGASNG